MNSYNNKSIKNKNNFLPDPKQVIQDYSKKLRAKQILKPEVLGKF